MFQRNRKSRSLDKLIRILPALALAITPLAVQAQAESGQWELSETDCQIPAQYWLVGTTLEDFHSAPECDRIHFRAGWGTKILVSKPIKPAFVIRELRPSLWIKATRSQIQMLVRVVLPRSTEPQGRGPMTVLLPGPVYRDANQWRKLDFNDSDSNLLEQLELAVWKLRAKYNVPVDDRDAYVDRIVVNLYGGPGSTTVWIDDLELPGAVDANTVVVDQRDPIRDPQFRLTGLEQQTENRRPALAQCNNTVLEVRGQPFFARMIQYNGEPFELLKDLGFNTIELSQPATVQQLRQAQQLDIWIVCPPPDSVGLRPISADFDRVLAWSAGEHLTAADLERIKTTRREINESDFRENRPLVAFADSDWFNLARAVDILSLGFEPIGGSFVLSQYSDWIRQRAELADKNLPLWVTIQTEIPRTIESQTGAIASRVPPLPLEPAQIKFTAYEAIAAGARGMRFSSRSRLDAGDPMARLRSLTLRWLNRHLDQLQPWICGGAVVNRTESKDRSGQITTLSTQRSRLVLIQRTSHFEQWTAGDAPVATYVFSDHNLGASEQPYHLSENGLIPLNQGRAMVGNEIKIDACRSLEAVVITQEPQVINRLAESYLLAGAQTQSQMHLSIAQQWLAISQLINDQLARIGQTQTTASGLINESNNALRQAQALINNGSAMTASRLLTTADQKLAAARRSILLTARSQFASSTSSPLLAHISLVPMHFELAQRINPEQWQANGLAGGDFESLQHMTENGWENHRADVENVQTHVELTASQAVSGSRALLMSVARGGSELSTTVIDRTPLWIKSAKVPVKSGQLVRIHGWVNISRPITSSLDGLMIIDSIGGAQLGERILATNGWQEFTIYRCPSQDTELQLTLALTGLGQAIVDEIDVRVLDLAPPASRQALYDN